MFDYLLALDKSLFLFFNTFFANPILDIFFKTITNGRFWIVPGFLGGIIFIKIKGKTAFVTILLMLITVAIADPLCGRILKPLFGRLRPCNINAVVDGGRFLLGHKTSLSFPSAHSMNWFAQATLLFCLYPRLGWWFFGFALTIGFSRIYVGVHYPADVLAGAFFGLAVGTFVFWGYKTITKNKLTT